MGSTMFQNTSTAKKLLYMYVFTAAELTAIKIMIELDGLKADVCIDVTCL